MLGFMYDRLRKNSFSFYKWTEAKKGYQTSFDSSQRKFETPSGNALDSQQILNELSKNGVTSIPNFFPVSYIDLLNEHVLKILTDHTPETGPVGDLHLNRFGLEMNLLDQGIYRYYAIDQKVPEILKFSQNHFIHHIGQQYYGRDIYSKTVIFQHNFVNEKGCRGWHIDSWVNQFKSFLYLSDVDENNGPFTYALKSHQNNEFLLTKTWNCFRGEDSTDIQHETVKKQGFEIKTFPGKKGTLLLADTRGIHKGGMLQSGSRNAVVNYFYPLGG